MPTSENPSLKLSNTYLQEGGKFLVSRRVSRAERDRINPKKEKLIHSDHLRATLTLGHGAIVSAMEAYRERQAAANPDTKEPIKLPWINVIRLCEYGEEVRVLQAIPPEKPHLIPATEYENADDLHAQFQPYWAAAAQAGFGVRIKSHMEGWDRIHDGTWLQVHRDREQPARSGITF